jgi:CMP-N,N'-diacetyllegionaminic acid synthase
MKILGIILSRKGSKGLKNKNRLKINGKSLVEIAIEGAKRSKFLDDILFSSNDDYLLKLAKKKKILVPFKRPESLSNDNSKTYDVVKHAVNWYEKNIDKVSKIVVLQPTTPFRNENHIDECIKKLENNSKANSIITVKEIDYPLEWSLKKEKKYIKFNSLKGKKIFKRQDAKKYFKPSGLVYVIKRDYFFKMKTILPNSKCLFLDTKAEDSINIDTEIHFKFATFLSKNRKL